MTDDATATDGLVPRQTTHVPPGCRVLVIGDDPAVTAALTARGCDVVVALDVDTLPSPRALRVEAVVAGVSLATAHRPEHVLELCTDLLEPAGVLVATVPTGAGWSGLPLAEVVATAGRAGWDVERIDPVVDDAPAGPVVRASVLVCRPPWTPDALLRAGARAAEPVDAVDLRVLVLGEPMAELDVALRASLPERLRIAPLDLDDDVDPGTPVLVLSPDVLPQPGWMQALWTGLSRWEVPVGVRVIDTAGHLVHAGADAEGRPFGAGSNPGDAPIFTADRPDATLLPPFLARARDLGTDAPVRGRFLGSHPAVSLDDDAARPTGAVAGIRDVFPESVVVCYEATPRRLDPDERAGLEQLVDGLLAAGVTPIVRWDETTPLAGRAHLDHLERRGAVLVGGSGAELPSDDDALVVRPEPQALVAAFAPCAVVFGDVASLARHLGVCVDVDRRVAAMICATDPDRLADGVRTTDLVVPWTEPDLAARVLEVAAATTTAAVDATALLGAARVAPVAVRSRRPGVVSVVVPVWNRWDLTEACLDALARHAEAPLEVIVVDNGSTDDTPAELAARAARGEIELVTNPTNLGFPRAANQGIRHAAGEFVCVLNNDTEVSAGWLREQLVALAVPGTGLVGPRSNRVSGLQQVPDAPGLDEPGTAHAWAARWAATRTGRSWPTDRLVGFCLLARAELFETLGAFDEGFGIGNFEDDDLCRRVLAAGQTLRVADGAVVLHHGHATFRDLDTGYAVHLLQARRHFGSRPGIAPGLLTGVVLSDGDAMAAARTASTVGPVTDRVRIIEERGLAATELAAGALASRKIEVVAAPVDGPDASTVAATAVAGTVDEWVLLTAAGELLDVDGDWGAFRHRLDRAAGEAIGLAVQGRDAEVRITRPTAGALAAMGSPADIVLAGTRIDADDRIPFTTLSPATTAAPPATAPPTTAPAAPPTAKDAPSAPPARRPEFVSLVDEPDPGVNVVGFVHAETGEGEVARQVVEVLRAGGIPYRVVPLTEQYNRQDHPFDDLGTVDRYFDTTIVCLGMNMLPAFAAHETGAQLLGRGPSVAIWPWEVEEFPAALADRAVGVDEIWGISRHGTQGLTRALSVPTRVFPLPVPLLEPSPGSDLRAPGDPFTFLFCFSYWSVMERKNPMAVIAAFREAFAPGEGPRLVIKSINGDTHPEALAAVRAAAAGRPDIEVRDGYVTAAEQRALVERCDAYVSLHRAEGFGFTVAEAMALGRPVIATAYSGTLDFTTSDVARLVPATRVPVPPGCAPYPTSCHWAEPSVIHAAAAMRELAHDPDGARALGDRARAWVRTRHAPANRLPVLRAGLDAVRQLVPAGR